MAYALEQNVPNPFNPTTAISFDLPVACDVSLDVYDVNGRVVARLVSAHRKAGRHTVLFTAKGLVNGVYFYRLNAGDYTAVRKMTLVR